MVSTERIPVSDPRHLLRFRLSLPLRGGRSTKPDILTPCSCPMLTTITDHRTEASRYSNGSRSCSDKFWKTQSNNALCPGLDPSCRHTLALHHGCAAFIPVTKVRSSRFHLADPIPDTDNDPESRTFNSAWCFSRFAVKKATNVGEVGFTCSNRRRFFTNSSPIAIRQGRHSGSETHLDPLSVLRWEPQTLQRTKSCGCPNPPRPTALSAIIRCQPAMRPGSMT